VGPRPEGSWPNNIEKPDGVCGSKRCHFNDKTVPGRVCMHGWAWGGFRKAQRSTDSVQQTRNYVGSLT
jgi:hypothetical protein